MKRIASVISLMLLLLFLCSCGFVADKPSDTIQLSDVPKFSDSPYVAINGNVPTFTDDEITNRSFEYYSPLDEFGRCGVAVACISTDIMPDGERGSIGQIKPTGWQTVKYDIVDGKYLYNRCHLIGFQLAGENANELNLITGTRYLNVDGMLPFENMVADYVKETENHVMYRVTPCFDGDNLLASGVQIEALSVEDDGDGICFNVYVYNNQPGVVIDYSTGKSHLEGVKPEPEKLIKYVINTSSRKFHFPDCKSVSAIKAENRKDYEGTREELIKEGLSPCGSCKP